MAIAFTSATVAGLMLAPTAAFAASQSSAAMHHAPAGNVQAGFDPDTTVTFAVTSGELTMTAPAAASLGSGAPGTNISGALGAVSVVIHRRILVVNQESHRSHFTVYPDAAQIKKGYFIGDAGHTRSELTTWTKVAHSRMTLGPEQSVMDLVTIKVPKIATRGEHYGVIWVQQAAKVRPSNGIAVKEIDRVGIRIYLAIGRGGVPATRFSVTSITGHKSPKGKPYLTALVRNTGGRAVDVSGTVRLTHGPGGTAAGPFSLQRVVTLAPGQSQPVTFAPPRSLPAGPWLATVKLVSGMTVERASATITFSAIATTSLWPQPVTIIWVSAITALILIGLWAGWRSRRTRPRGVHGIGAPLRVP